MNLMMAIPLLLYALMPQAVGGSGTIHGTACDFDGCKPISGARISVEIPNSGGVTRTVITDETGGFTLTQLPAGRYQLEAQADAFNPVALLPLVTLSDGGRADDLRVLMALSFCGSG